VKESANVPSNEGLILALDTSLLFHLDRSMAAEVYQKVGSNYAEKIVEPTLRAAIRASTSSHTANALYTNARELVQQQIQDQLTKELSPRGVIVENILLRDVQLPAMLKGSIEAKQQAEQDALRMSFILQKETQEAQRKRIEAQGIADFQKIVAQASALSFWNGRELKPPKNWPPVPIRKSWSLAIPRPACRSFSARSNQSRTESLLMVFVLLLLGSRRLLISVRRQFFQLGFNCASSSFFCARSLCIASSLAFPSGSFEKSGRE